MENIEKENKRHKVLLVILVVILLGLGSYHYYVIFVNVDKNNETEVSENNIVSDNNTANATDDNAQEVNDTFSITTNSGVVEVIGYPEIREMIDEMNTGEKYSYVFFHITETNSNNFKEYINSLKGNAFVLDNAIGIGCKKENIIEYFNSSDETGKGKYYELSLEDSSRILNATNNNPIKLKLERKTLTYGGGASACYSHITTIEVEN